MSIAFFLPVRLGSKRVINKNTRPFAGIEGGLLELKLEQLINCASIDYIVLSTNDERASEIALLVDPGADKIKIINRPDELCQDDTNLTDLIRYVPEIISADHIFWGHTTTPMAGTELYEIMISEYFRMIEQGYDSLVSVQVIKNFIIDPNTSSIINSDIKGQWPRTQDLKELYEVNHAAFISSRSNYKQYDDRVGKNPFFYKMNKIQSVDVDWEEDFKIAEILYEELSRL